MSKPEIPQKKENRGRLYLRSTVDPIRAALERRLEAQARLLEEAADALRVAAFHVQYKVEHTQTRKARAEAARAIGMAFDWLTRYAEAKDAQGGL